MRRECDVNATQKNSEITDYMDILMKDLFISDSLKFARILHNPYTFDDIQTVGNTSILHTS